MLILVSFFFYNFLTGLVNLLRRRQLLLSPPAALAVSQTFENSLYVTTSSVGLDLHMETSEGAPWESFLRGVL